MKSVYSPEFVKTRNEIQLQVLGWLVSRGSSVMPQMIEAVADNDFSGVYRDAWELLKKQYIETQDIDVIELSQKIKGIPLSTYNAYGGMLLNTNDLRNAVQRLKKSAQVERILLACADMAQKAEAGDFDISKKLLDEVIAEDLQTGGRWQSFGEVAASLLENKRDIYHVFSKFPTLNECVYSYKSGDLHIVAARPGVGKTTYLLNEAVAIARQGVPVGFITLEMPAQQCVRRVIAMEIGVEFRELYNKERLAEVLAEHEDKLNLPINFYENYSLDWQELLLKIRRIVKSGARVIFIDQLSHIKHDSRAYSKADAIEKTVRAIRSLALELNIVIIMAVQINRQASQAETPDLEHLKDSGSIEEASQLVLMLQRKDGALKAYIRKATHGRLGEFALSFQADVCRVEESGQAMTW